MREELLYGHASRCWQQSDNQGLSEPLQLYDRKL